MIRSDKSDFAKYHAKERRVVVAVKTAKFFESILKEL
jgi:hypothetical protein